MWVRYNKVVKIRANLDLVLLLFSSHQLDKTTKSQFSFEIPLKSTKFLNHLNQVPNSLHFVCIKLNLQFHNSP